MKTIMITTGLLFAAFSFKAQTSTETRDIKPFKHLDISGAASVEYTQSDTLSLKVFANSDDLSNVVTVSDGETLVIKSKGSTKNGYTVKIASNGLNQVVCNGASKLLSTNTVMADSLNIDVTGASTVRMEVKTRAVDVVTNGASTVDLAGTTAKLYTNANGASTIKAYKLNATTVNAVAGGASTVKVFASDKINANATGASTIKFKGDPKEVGVEASMSSTIAKVAADDSQKRIDGRDSTTFNFKKKKFIIIDGDKDSEKEGDKDDDFHHWAGFSMGLNGWMSSGGSLNLPKSSDYMSLNYAKSLNFQLNPFERDFKIYKNYVHLVTGLGFEWNQYEFSNPVTLNADSSYTSGKLDTTGINYRKNRLKSTFVNVPLMVEFNTNKNPDKSFHIAVGVIGGYKLGSRTRQVFPMNGDEIRNIRKDSYNINPIRVNAHASIGYANWTFFADYALTPLFESGKGPQLYPVTVGLRVIPF
ncbi:MAG: DUF2807 domain-containing protein [Bacteroidetes bacterium]|nr:DUF2807 domain-containing protein [Bacteroidota bacterium]